jgi:hypothetical protein
MRIEELAIGTQVLNAGKTNNMKTQREPKELIIATALMMILFVIALIY